MLQYVQVKSIYNNGILLPPRLAQCTPDMANGLTLLQKELSTRNLTLVVSDMYRSYDMQHQAHLDYTSKKKIAFSPPPGGSMHEAGRAIDIDIKCLGHLTLKGFRTIARSIGFMEISLSEPWHFDFRGSFQKIYTYALNHNSQHAYQMMASCAILDQHFKVDNFEHKYKEYNIQSRLVRLDKEIGDIDGIIGRKCLAALKELGYDGGDDEIDNIDFFTFVKIKEMYPMEYAYVNL